MYGVNVRVKNLCCCPIHDDHNPSCMIYPASNSWYCFGCQRGGSVIDLVMYREKVDFIEACNILRNMVGITDEELYDSTYTSAPIKPDRLMKTILNSSMIKPQEGEVPPEKYLEDAQKNRHIYLADRGFPDGIWDAFELGFALYGDLANRIIIPWRGVNGKLVTLQGRAVDNIKEEKYKVWDKSYKTNTLYGLYYNLEHIRCKKEMVIFEGATKVWRAWQHSMFNCCAIGGASPSAYQLKQIIKYGQLNLVLWLDNDKAGSTGVNEIVKAAKDICQIKIIKSEVKPDDIIDKEAFWEEYAGGSRV